MKLWLKDSANQQEWLRTTELELTSSDACNGQSLISVSQSTSKSNLSALNIKEEEKFYVLSATRWKTKLQKFSALFRPEQFSNNPQDK